MSVEKMKQMVILVQKMQIHSCVFHNMHFHKLFELLLHICFIYKAMSFVKGMMSQNNSKAFT